MPEENINLEVFFSLKTEEETREEELKEFYARDYSCFF